MNERIKQLAKQAAKDDRDGYPVTLEYTNRFAEKFAELIAKECIRLCDQVDLVGADECMDNIKEHFGIE